MTDEYHELLDLVDGEDKVVGTMLRGKVAEANYRLDGKYVRFVNGFVVNKDGLVWAQIRSLRKFIAPGGLDYSVAEHVFAGEAYDQAIIRGFQEELGWQIDPAKLLNLGVLPPTESKPVFDRFYALLDYAGPDPILNTDEFTSGEWMDIPAVRQQLATSSSPQKGSLAPALDLLERALKERAQ